jgi:hypothetical protein
MVSMGVEGEQVPAQRWNLVWKHQLRLVSEGEFWKGLHGEPVQYAIAAAPDLPTELPPDLIRFLRDMLHRSETEIEAMTRDDAQRLLDEYYSRELRET